MKRTSSDDRVTAPRPTIERIGYRPRGGYAFDVELLRMAELRQRVGPAALRRPHRLEYHQLVCVTEGRCSHAVDFEPVDCVAGSVVALHPSQTEQFDVVSAWDGWLVLFRPEFLPRALGSTDETSAQGLDLPQLLAGLPVHLALPAVDFEAVQSLLARMQQDAASGGPAPQVQALLRYQLCALLVRLALAAGAGRSTAALAARERRRFQRFRALLEQSHANWHQVAPYAQALGCSEKTLSRTTQALAGTNAKAFISARLALEAKRLLTHSAVPVGAVAEQLGFDDASNFVKFFRRHAGCAPSEFRRRGLEGAGAVPS
jgi:AraC-like DNA-binding protein